MSQSSASGTHTKRQARQRRKPTIWTREKISKLIELYRTSDCLWNHYSELYKNKDCRNKAIEHICQSLGITKNDYGKKVHNLRNQFNSELKKLERRLEESGGAAANVKSSPLPEKSCRWEHFETLMFLRSVIEPRPGYQTMGPQSQSKKIFTKLEYTYTDGDVETPSPSIAKCPFEDMEQLICADDTSESHENQKACEAITATTIASLPSSASATVTDSLQNLTQPAVFAVPPPTQVQVTAGRDQWDAFGELIANEFRNLNTPLSRKKLKRRIMQVMLEVGEEDDQQYAGFNT